MANLRAIRKRIGSVKSTQQITKAMKMVSAAKLKRAQDAIVAARPYARLMREVVQAVARRAGQGAAPRRRIPLGKEFINILGSLSYSHAEQLSKDLVGGFIAGDFDEVQIVFNEFRSAISQVVRFEKLFPIALEPKDSEGSAAVGVDYLS